MSEFRTFADITPLPTSESTQRIEDTARLLAWMDRTGVTFDHVRSFYTYRNQQLGASVLANSPLGPLQLLKSWVHVVDRQLMRNND